MNAYDDKLRNVPFFRGTALEFFILSILSNIVRAVFENAITHMCKGKMENLPKVVNYLCGKIGSRRLRL